jgi:hypothetical protein
MPFGSNAARLQALKGSFGTDATTIGAPATVYFALLREATNPDTVLGAEPDSTGNYARVAMANTDANWTFGTVSVDNTNEIRWPQATGVYSITAELNQWAIYDNSAGGTLIAFGELTTGITVTGSGDEPVLPVGNLDITMDV